jgi:hypothetical protein
VQARRERLIHQERINLFQSKQKRVIVVTFIGLGRGR